MPASIARHQQLPLIIATLTGNVVTDDIVEIFKRSAELMTPDNKVVFRITHVVDAESTFAEMLKAIQEATLSQDASSADERIRVVFVGTSSWITFARNAFNKRGIHIPAFDSMKTALDYVRLELEKLNMDASVLDELNIEETPSQSIDV